MADTKKSISIEVSAKDKASKELDTIATKLKGLKAAAGEDSTIANFAKIATGAGAVAGLTLVGSALSKASGEARKFFDEFRAGKADVNEAIAVLAQGLPIVGNFVKAGRDIREIFTGEQFGISVTNAQTAAQDARVGQRAKSREATTNTIGSLRGIASDYADKSELVGASGFYATLVRLRQDYTRARAADNAKIEAAVKSVGEQAAITITDGPATSTLQGIEQIRATYQKLRTELSTPISKDLDGFSLKKEIDRRLQIAPEVERLKQVIARVDNDIKKVGGEQLGITLAREVFFGKTFASESVSAFNSSWAIIKANALAKFNELEAAKKKTTEDTKAFSDKIGQAVAGALGKLNDAALAFGGQDGLDKYLRSQSIAGRAFNFGASFFGRTGGPDAQTEDERRQNAKRLYSGPVRLAEGNSDKYLTGVKQLTRPDNQVMKFDNPELNKQTRIAENTLRAIEDLARKLAQNNVKIVETNLGTNW